MNYNHFGELLKKIRKDNNLTLDELSKDICSTRQLSRIEKGESNPSLHVLHNLSKKLNIDFQEFYRIGYTSGSFENHSIRLKIGQLITNGEDDVLRKLIAELNNKEDFKSGENLQYILYGKAICSTHIDKDYKQSNAYCFEGIYIEEPTFNIKTMENNLYSNVALTLINLLASNFIRMKNKKSTQIFEKIMLILDNYILDNPFPIYPSLDFEKRLYQSTSYNLSIIHMDNQDYEKSLGYINKGITLSKEKNHMRFLPELLAQKSRLLYKMNHYDESYKTFKNCLSFYQVCRSKDEIKKIEKEIEDIFH